jgi:hypothetical protein
MSSFSVLPTTTPSQAWVDLAPMTNRMPFGFFFKAILLKKWQKSQLTRTASSQKAYFKYLDFCHIL